MEFNKHQLVENITLLIKQHGLKVGELEKSIGVSTGYFSRLAKKDNDSAPAMDTICKIADALSVSLDFLVNADLTKKATNNSMLMENFIKYLIRETDATNLEWNKYTADTVELLGVPDSDIISNHKIYNLGCEELEIDCYDTIEYNAMGKVVVDGDFFAIKMSGYTLLMTCMKWDFKNYPEGSIYGESRFFELIAQDTEFEEYDYDGNPLEETKYYIRDRLCNSALNPELRGDLEMLYECLVRHGEDLVISPKTRKRINSLIFKNIPFEEEVPF